MEEVMGKGRLFCRLETDKWLFAIYNTAAAAAAAANNNNNNTARKEERRKTAMQS